MGKACEECTQHCLKMHRRDKNPESLVTTFVKVMIGDDFLKTLFLPPKFACRVKKLVGKTTHLEDFNGEKWDVRFTKIDNRLAFEEGWNTFALKHGLEKGDILVFHYIMKKHFVVLMYGKTGCPEIRHFGFHQHPDKETKKSNNNLTVNGQSSSKVHTNRNDMSDESSSKSEPVHGVNDMKALNRRLKDAKISPNENTTNSQHLVTSSARPLNKETDQRSEPLVNNALPNYKFSDCPTTPEPLWLVDHDNGRKQDEHKKNSLQPVVVESDGGQKNSVAASGGGSDETEINKNQNLVESDGGLKNNVAASGGGSNETDNNTILKYLEPDGSQKKNAAASGGQHKTETNRIPKLVESDGGQRNNVTSSGGGLDKTEIRKSLDIRLAKSTEKLKKSNVIQSEAAHSNSMHKRSRPANDPIPPAKSVKGEPVNSVSRLHNSGYPSTSIRISTKPMDGSMEPVKKELMMKEESTKKEPKSEPVEYEAPLSASSNPSFSAIMSSYQYLELPHWVKLKSDVILLRNGADLWPVMFQNKFGLKALTQNWSIFAKEKGIKPGDKCKFVLESEPESNRCSTCSLFGVHVTR